MALDANLARLIAVDFCAQHISNLKKWSDRTPDMWTLLHTHFGVNPIEYAFRERLRLSLTFAMSSPVHDKALVVNQLIGKGDQLSQQLMYCVFLKRKSEQAQLIAMMMGQYRD